MEGEDSEEDEEHHNQPDRTTYSCKCKKQCLQAITEETITEHIYNMREMDRESKDMYIMGCLDTVIISEKRCLGGKRRRERHQYSFRGNEICREAFLILFDIGTTMLKNIKTHVRQNGNVPRTNKNKGRRPHHALSFQDIERVVHFILAYGKDHGLPQPAAPRGRADIAPTYLPASTTKLAVHGLYVEGCQAANVRVVQRCAFNVIWRQMCSHIKVSTMTCAIY